jgi:hypothetical protein
MLNLQILRENSDRNIWYFNFVDCEQDEDEEEFEELFGDSPDQSPKEKNTRKG